MQIFMDPKKASEGAIVQLSKDGTKLWKLIAAPAGKFNDWYPSFNGSSATHIGEQSAKRADDHRRLESSSSGDVPHEHDALVAHYDSSQPCGNTPCLYELFSDPTERHDLHSAVRSTS